MMKLITFALVVAMALPAAIRLPAQTPPAGDLTADGRLRVALNVSNAMLVSRAADGSFGGLAVDLGRFIAGALDVAYDPVPYSGSAAFTGSFGKNEWDIVVTSDSPHIAPAVQYAGEVLHVDYRFLAGPSLTFADTASVDRPGVTIAVGRNTSADAFLSSNLKSATVRRTSGQLNEVIDLLRRGEVQAYGNITEGVMAAAAQLPGSTVVPGAFMTVTFYVATPKGKSAAALERLKNVVADAKRAGLVQRAIERDGLNGVRVAQ